MLGREAQFESNKRHGMRSVNHSSLGDAKVGVQARGDIKRDDRRLLGVQPFNGLSKRLSGRSSCAKSEQRINQHIACPAPSR